MEQISSQQLLKQTQDRTLSATVSLLALCPKMDLLAVALDRNSIAIFRTSWQRLATIAVCTNPDDAITSITWSPTGAYLAVVTSSATLMIHSVDRATSAASSRTRRASRDTDPVANLSLPSAPSAVVWVPRPPLVKRYEDRASLLLHAKAELQDAKPDPVEEPGFLFIADHDGMLTIITTNLAFVIARRRVMLPQFSICHLHVTSSLRHCLAVGYRDTSHGAGESNDNCMMRIVHIDVLLDYFPEIERVTKEVVALKAHFSTFENAQKQIEESWISDARSVFTSSIVKPLEKVMADYGETGNVWEELYNAFCGARVRGALLHFLGNNVGENGAKELLRSFRVHEEDTEESVLKMQSLAENALSRGSEYLGLSRLTSRFAPIGVSHEDAKSVLQAADELFSEVTLFARDVKVVSSETESFLTWLIIAALKAGGESAQGRAGGNMENMKAKETGLAAKFLSKMSKIESPFYDSPGCDAVTAMFTMKLRPVLQCWRQACEKLISRPCDVISKALQVAGGVTYGIKMYNSPTDSMKCFVYDKGQGQDGAVMAFISTRTGGLVCVHHKLFSGVWCLSQCGFKMNGLTIDDAVMTSEKKVALVTSKRNSLANNEKIVCQIGIYDFVPSKLWNGNDGIVVGKDEVLRVLVGTVVAWDKAKCGWSFSAQKEKTSDLSLSVNADTKVMR